MKTILITGGAGYIGSHICLQLLEEGFNVVIMDNLSNSSKEVLLRIEKLSGKKADFYLADIRDKSAYKAIFENHKIDGVIHMAGLKAVGESVIKPVEYYDNNICGTMALIEAMENYNVKKLIFSSSATVYDTTLSNSDGLSEQSPVGFSASPYGRTKVFIEQILTDVSKAKKDWCVVLLRYFNPIGAHPSGDIGENPNGIPNNLMPFITQVAVGKLTELSVFGKDYNTKDGTCIRDYIHVCDLAKGHSAAIKKFEEEGVHIYNLGTGKPKSVLEVISAFEEANNLKIPYKIMPRRAGDAEICFAQPKKANKELNWQANYDIIDMCKHSYNWQKKNPNGY